MKTVFMFPGQGSQSVGMMAELLEQSQIARQVFEQASAAVDLDLKALALQGPEEEINRTEITQPLILTASVAVWRAWQERTALRPDFVCGHSLGEYTALVAAEALSLEDAVRLVRLRGQLMQNAVPAGEGAMAALLGLDDEVVVQVCAEAAQGDVVAAVNFNSPGQVVISGQKAALERAIELAKTRGAKRAAMLAVSVPCHCALLEPAGKSLAAAIDKLDLRLPSIPVMQNVNARIATDLAGLKANLVAHLYSPVQWTQSIRNLAAEGASVFVECGPGKVLSGLTKRIDKNIQGYSVSDLATIDDVLAALNP